MAYKKERPIIAGTEPHKKAKKAKMLEGTTIFGKTIPEIKKIAGEYKDAFKKGWGTGKKINKGYLDALKTGYDTGKNAEKLVAQKRAVKKGAEEGVTGGVAGGKMGLKKVGRKLLKSKKSIKGLDKGQSRKDRLDYESGGMGDGSN